MIAPLSKAEIRKAVERHRPKRVPRYMSFYSSEIKAKYGNELQAVLDEYPDDFLIYDLLLEIWGWPADTTITRQWVDAWGVTWICPPGGAGMVPLDSDLHSSWDDLQHYIEKHIPSLQQSGFLSSLRQRVKLYPDSYLVAHCGLGPYERLRSARGTENMARDLYLNPKEILTLLDAVGEYFRGLIRLVGSSGADAFMLSDDFGIQRSMLMSPKQWREFFKPWFRTLIGEIHTSGMSAWLHCCGNITAIVPDLIEIELDVLHPIQPHAMDQAQIVRTYGDQISFFGGIDVQSALPFGTPEDVDDHIRWLVETFNGTAGGFILGPANTLTPEIPLENLRSMYRASEKYAFGNQT